MADQVKDLGGLVNKDMAFSKVQENVIYDSKNFRVTTDDGATLAVRSNIKGNSFAMTIPDIPCTDTITVDRELLNTYLVGGNEYTVQFYLNGTTYGYFVFTYLDGNTFITELTDFINTDTSFTDYGISATSNVLTSTITLSVPDCITIEYQGFTAGSYGSNYVTAPYKVLDYEFQLPNNLDNALNYNQYYDYTTGILPQFPAYGTLKDHYWNFDYINANASSSFTPYFQSRFVTGIYDSYLNSTVYRSEKAILYRDFGDSTGITDTNSRVLLFNAGVENIFPVALYTGRTLEYIFKYYIGQLDSSSGFTNAKIKVLAECEGTWGTPPTYVSYTNITETGTTTEYTNLVELYTTNITQSEDHVNYPITFNYAFPNGVTPRRYVISVELEPTSHGSTWNVELYLAALIISGPFLSVPFLTITNTASSVSAPQIIGWTTLRSKNADNIYLLTTDGVFDPDDSTTGPFTSYGQWWKFTYPKEGDYSDPNIYSLTLVYNNELNLTTYRPVANPGMIESRYENEYIQKIYWTDNYNVPRVINVTDPNVASLAVEDLNLQPSLSMDMPLITEVIDGGSLLMGVYQVAYRLKNTNGAETRFSRTSQLIPIIDAPEANASILNYFPRDPIIDTTTNPSTSTVAQKSIRVDVSNIDTTYDTIEFALIYYENSVDIPQIDIVKETYIPDSGSVSIVITGAEAPVPITVDELTAFTTNIKTAKTLAAKKQTLFLGNLTIGSQVVEWDARAYRFPNRQRNTFIKDILGNTYTIDSDANYVITNITDVLSNVITVNPAIDVPYNYDCIQDYDSQAPTDDINYLYQANSDVLGGSGPNVSYEFVTETTMLDNKYDVADNGVYSPHMTVDSYYTIVLDQAPYFKSKGVSMSNNASPYVYDMFVGYRRDEMERFGIVFFDELDNPSYVNWIADIRMPHIYMPETSYGSSTNSSLSAPYQTGSATKRTRIGVGSAVFSSDITYYDTTNKRLYGKPLGIKFTIDFSGVPSKYKKAAIVRVPKKEEDKHITGQGLFMPAWKYFGARTGPEDTGGVFLANPHLSNYLATNRATFNDTWYDCWSFHSPEFLFKAFPGYSGNDTIDVLSLLSNNENVSNYAWHGENAGSGNFYELDGYSYNIGNCYFAALRGKTYETIESINTPGSIKYANSNSPYPVVQAVSLERGGSDRKFNTGVTAFNDPLSGITMTRTVRNCSPKELSGIAGGVDGGSDIINGYSIHSKSIFVQLQWDKAYNWNASIYSGNDYLMSDGFATGGPSDGAYLVYLSNYKRNLAPGVQFGGNDYFARANNVYIPCNNLIDISDKTNPISTKVFGGDTRVAVMDHVPQFFDYAEAAAYSSTININMIMLYFPVETSIAVDYRRSATGNIAFNPSTQVPNRCQYIGIPGAPNDALWYTSPRMANTEHFEVDDVFNHTDKTVYSYFPAPALGKISGIYDCRIWKSEPKVDGELVESWSIFRPSAYKDVESAYGPINNLIIFQDKMFYFQDRAFGIAQVDEQKLLKGANTSMSDLVLGSSGILERYDYISTKTGTKHQFSMSVSDYSIIWFDILGRKLYRYKPDGVVPVSDIKGFNAYLYKNTEGLLQIWDNPYLYRGIHSTYDFRHNEFYTTFVMPESNIEFTLVYNDLLDGFIGEYTHYPKVYINDKTNIFSPDPFSDYPVYDELYVHNYGPYCKFYGAPLALHSSVSFIINDGPNVEKVLNNLEVVAEAYSSNSEGTYYNPLAATDFYDFFDSMRIFDNYQNTDWQSLSTLSRKHKTLWNIKVPSDRVLDTTQNIFSPANLASTRPRLTKRLKDKWFMVELDYNNSSNNKLVVHSAKGIYTVNSR
jgi:hypothetical protein